MLVGEVEASVARMLVAISDASLSDRTARRQRQSLGLGSRASPAPRGSLGVSPRASLGMSPRASLGLPPLRGSTAHRSVPATTNRPTSLSRTLSSRASSKNESLKTKVHSLNLHHRADAKTRKDAERQLLKNEVDEWMRAHRLLRRVDVPTSQRESLREVFDMIDADRGGTIDLQEMSVIMEAQGFKKREIQAAIAIGDANGDGELDFEVRGRAQLHAQLHALDQLHALSAQYHRVPPPLASQEFVSLVGSVGRGKTYSDTTAEVAGPAGNTFPFALVANGYRITQLISDIDPAIREAKLRLPKLSKLPEG